MTYVAVRCQLINRYWLVWDQSNCAQQLLKWKRSLVFPITALKWGTFFSNTPSLFFNWLLVPVNRLVQVSHKTSQTLHCQIPKPRGQAHYEGQTGHWGSGVVAHSAAVAACRESWAFLTASCQLAFHNASCNPFRNTAARQGAEVPQGPGTEQMSLLRKSF